MQESLFNGEKRKKNLPYDIMVDEGGQESDHEDKKQEFQTKKKPKSTIFQEKQGPVQKAGPDSIPKVLDKSAKGAKFAFEIEIQSEDPSPLKIEPIKSHKKYIVETSENFKEMEYLQSAIKHRRFMRYCAYFTYLIGTITAIVVISNKLMIRKELAFDNHVNLNFNIDNCTLMITDNTSPDIPEPIYVKYQVPTELMDAKTKVVVEPDTKSPRFEIMNALDSHYCLIKVLVREGALIGSLKINCIGCNVTQDTSFQLKVEKDVTIKGKSTHANFRNIKLATFSFETITGYLQLNNIESEPGVNSAKIEKRGDIIIQSTQDFRLNASSNTQAFCLNAPALRQIDISNCAISGQDSTTVYKGATDCHLTYDMCSEERCMEPSVNYKVSSNGGNIYANLIPSVGKSIPQQKRVEILDDGLNIQAADRSSIFSSDPDSTIAKGQIYDDGIQFTLEANEAISRFNSIIIDESKGNPFLVIDLGDMDSRSSKYSKWVISSSPSYALMRPYWMGTFSATILNGYVDSVNGFLLPGFCPFFPEFTVENLFEIQKLIQSKITSPDALITFISDEKMPDPPVTPRPSTGIFPSIEGGTPNDNWFNLKHQNNGDILLENNDYTKKPGILTAAILSLIITSLVTFILIRFIIFSINIAHLNLVEYSKHLTRYIRLQTLPTRKAIEKNEVNGQRNIKKTGQKSLESSKASLAQMNFNAPAPSAFIDYLVTIIYSQFSSSAIRFYQILFRLVDDYELQTESLDPAYHSLKASELKLLYERFCFMNRLVEEKLTDPKNIKIPKEYGFQFIFREDMLNKVVTRVKIKDSDNMVVEILEEQKTLNSLELFMKLKVETSEFEEDQVELDTFLNCYNLFCNYNRLSKVSVSPSFLMENYGVNMISVSQSFLVRIPETSQDEEQTIGITKRSKKKLFIIDVSRLDSYFNLIMENYQLLTSQQLSSAILDRILFRNWQLFDIFAVLYHLMVNTILTLPLIGLVILSQSQYGMWSLRDPLTLIRFEDIIQDPKAVVFNLFNNTFTWNKVFVITACILYVVGTLNHLLYYSIMKFPAERGLMQNQHLSFLHSTTRKLEWSLILFAFILYFGYITLVLTWLSLGAFINPKALLPFASTAVTFVTLIISKFNSFKQLSREGTKIVDGYVKKIFESSVIKTLEKFAEGIEKMTKDLLQQNINSTLRSISFRKLTNKLADAGLLNENDLSQYIRRLEALKADENDIKDDPKEVNLKAKEVSRDMEQIKKDWKEDMAQKVRGRYGEVGVVEFMIATLVTNNSRTSMNILCGSMMDSFQRELLDIVFPQGNNKEQLVDDVINEIVKFILLNAYSEEKPATQNFDTLVRALNAFTYLERSKNEAFSNELKLLMQGKENGIKEIELIMPIFEFVSLVAQNNPEVWRIRESCLHLLKLATKNSSSENKDIADFIQILSMILGKHQSLYSIERMNYMETQDIYPVITRFWESKGTRDSSLIQSMSCLTYLIITYINQDIHNLPKDVKTCLNLNYGEGECKNLFSFCFKLANVMFSGPSDYNERLDQSLSCYGLAVDLEKFLKLITSYHLDDHTIDILPLDIVNNSYLGKIANSMRIKTEEVLGLIDIIYNKKSNKHMNTFFEAILTKINVNKNKRQLLMQIAQLFLSKDEALLLQTVQALKLEHEEFLLIGKGLLDPKFVSEARFREMGIKSEELLNNKETIFNETLESFVDWKNEICRNILTTEGGDNRMSNLVCSFLSDWENISYLKANIKKLLVSIANKDNNIQKAVFNMDFLGKEVSFLITIIEAKSLQMDKARRESSFNKEQQDALKSLAEGLEVSTQQIEGLVDMFTTNDLVTILSGFFTFFPEEKAHKETIKRALISSFKQISIIERQRKFLLEELPTSIDLPSQERQVNGEKEKDLRVPSSIINKIFFGTSKISCAINDFMRLSSMVIQESSLKPVDQDILLQECYKIALFSKGFFRPYLELEDTSPYLDHATKPQDILTILTEPNINQRMSLMTGLFDEVEDPFKIFIAVNGLLTGRKFEVQRYYHSFSSVKVYLSEVMNYYPELFDLFDLIFEQDPINFIKTAMPFIKRKDTTYLLNGDLIETLFLMSLGLRFQPIYLAEGLEIPPDVIDFLMSLVRIRLGDRNFEEISNLSSTKKILYTLRIRVDAFLAILKLIFNEFDDDNDIEDEGDSSNLRIIVTKLNINIEKSKDKSNKGLINLDLLRGLVKITQGINAYVNVFRNRDNLIKLQKELVHFWHFLGLEKYQNEAFVISQLVAGNFLVLGEQINSLKWTFPTNDAEAEGAIVKLTMAICGLINPVIQSSEDTSKEADNFIKALYPWTNSSKFTYQQQKSLLEAGDTILPNNSLAYAIYLAYHAIDIEPFWTKAFLLDENIFSPWKDKIMDIRPEFVLSVVLNFMRRGDVAGDVLGLYEWTKRCVRTVQKDSRESLDKEIDDFLSVCQEHILRFFDSFDFDYTTVKEMASKMGLLKKDYFSQLFNQPVKAFHAKVNSSFIYLLTFHLSSEKQTELSEVMKAWGSDPSKRFLYQLKNRIKFEKVKDLMDNNLVIGYLIRKAIKISYKLDLSTEPPIIKAHRISSAVFTDFSLLTTIMRLRNWINTQMPIRQQIYNLNLLVTNVERKMFFENAFFKMSKFRLMKLAGMCLDLKVHNILEWCLPPSLLTPKYVFDLQQAQSEEARRLVQVKECKRLLTTKGVEVGDLGQLRGLYSVYKDNLSSLILTNGWNAIENLLDLPNYYFCEPQDDNVAVFEEAQQKYSWYYNKFRPGTTDENYPPIYLSRELVSLKDTRESSFPPLKDAERFKPPYPEERRHDSIDSESSIFNLKDPKTGLLYNDLIEKDRTLERLLNNPNLKLIQKIIQGDLSGLTKGNHEVAKGSLARAKTYMALIGIQSYRRIGKENRPLLNKCLSILLAKEDIKLSKLEEILMFLIHGKQMYLALPTETADFLELDRSLLDLFFMRAVELDSEKQKAAEKERFSVAKLLERSLGVSEDVGKMFEIIRNIYLLENLDKNAWDYLCTSSKKTSQEKLDSSSEDKNGFWAKLLSSIDIKTFKENRSINRTQAILKALKFGKASLGENVISSA